MPALYSVQIRTHTGGVRDINEDAVSTVLDWRGRLALKDEDLQTRGHLFAVADGMGGHAAGEIASTLAIETLFQSFYTSDWTTPEEVLASAIAAANAVLCEQAEANLDYEGMGTTLVAALLRDSNLIVANVGDSRAYLFRRGEIRQITRDHSWVEEQMGAGVLNPEDAARHPYRNVITRSLGPERDPRPDFFHLSTMPEDRVLLCTDGLSNLLSGEELAQFLSAYPSDEASDILIEQTLERGAPDNVTLAMIEILGQTERVHRRSWPYIVLALLIIAFLGYISRDQWLSHPIEPEPSPVAGNATLLRTPTSTVVSTQEAAFASPLQSPLVTPEPVYPGEPIPVRAIELSSLQSAGPTPDLVERFGTLGASGESPRRFPPREFYVYYIEGIADIDTSGSQTLDLRINHSSAGQRQFTYEIPLDRSGLYDSALPPAGTHLGVIARPASEELTGDNMLLEPLLVIDRSFAAGTGRPVWVANGALDSWLETADKYWVFTVNGPGGADGLGNITVDGPVGQPIVLWGGWQQLAETPQLLEFVLIDDLPYVLDDDVYRQPESR